MSKSKVKNRGYISYNILIDGLKIKSTFIVQNIIVFNEAYKGSSCEITLLINELEYQENSLSDNLIFDLGNTIQIELGYNSENVPVFKGYIYDHELVVNSTEQNIKIRCKDYLSLLKNSYKNRVFNNKKIDEIIQEVFKENKAKLKFEQALSDKIEYIQQNGCNDYDFVSNLLIRNGYIMYTHLEENFAKKIEVKSKEELTLTNGVDVIEFIGSISINNIIDNLTVIGWDFKANKKIEKQFKLEKVDTGGKIELKKYLKEKISKSATLYMPNLNTVPAIEKFGKAYIELLKQCIYVGSVKIAGYARLKIGHIVKLIGFGARFNGNIVVRALEHDYSDGDWTTTIEFGFKSILDQYPNELYRTNGNINGLDTGTVTKIYKTKDELLNVEVELDSSASKENKIIATVASPFASNGFGLYCPIQIGDQVIISYMHNDYSAPIIMGNLNNTKNKLAKEIAENPDQLCISTKSKSSFIIDDKNQAITLKTADKNIIMMNQKEKEIKIADEHNNSIILSKKGIEINSSKDLVINAKGKVNINGNGDVNIQSKAKIGITGNGIDQNSKMKLVLKATAGVDMNTNGIMNLKGTLININ